MQAVTETVNQWLQQMSLGWEAPLSLDEEGTCSIRSGNGYLLELYVVEAAACCYFSIPLMPVPHDDRETFYETVLAFNVHQQETSGGTLAVDPNEKRLMLCYSQPVPALTSELFSNLIQNLISSAASLEQKLTERQMEAGSETDSAGFAQPAFTTDTTDRGQVDHQPAQHQFSHFMSLV
ncbi:CesT family type III secretion system chaperone [Acanthopleuribacter pedis]|uniref:Type III secretion system chaperone n=1 Tax=Acanthopleuribacter pedis TaxID=442870 RepID=A0A8J7U2I4_9BACT|nr:CesT family type III secretion system chaperone [Acanthopleuribacter pedis]MBO1317278.1 type III secretion system chaperone [Acanthopleuribacter pedis]MBO1318585.1 type III secretion system chaperone [Acanthopleuribacter pedis]